MLILKSFSSNPAHVALVHIADPGDGKSPPGMTADGVLKLAAFLWAAGPRAYFADVPPLKGERAHRQCDEWAAMPPFTELGKPLGKPQAVGGQSDLGLYTRRFGENAKVALDGVKSACIVWADGTHSVAGK